MSGYIAPQQPIQPQPPLQPVYQEEKGLTVCGIVGVVFGALGFVLSFIPIINNIAAIFGFIGVILAIVALVGTFRGKKRGKALAIVAAVLSVLAIVITLAMQSAASKAIDEATGVSSSQSSAKGSAKNQPKGDQDMEGDLKTMHVKIVSAVRSNNDYNNQPRCWSHSNGPTTRIKTIRLQSSPARKCSKMGKLSTPPFTARTLPDTIPILISPKSSPEPPEP